MDEEPNDHDLEEKLYAMLHHVDETQHNLVDNHQNKLDAAQLVEGGPRGTLQRYWRVNPYQKINTPKNPPPPASKPNAKPDTVEPKEEQRTSPNPISPVDLSIFQSPIPQNVTKTIVYLDHEEDNAVLLESSDEDEVVEVALPPKPTITIDSSDEDELQVFKPKGSPNKTDSKSEPKSTGGERAVSASPVPSVVSSVSDEFIRGDCIALNISSRHPDKHSFDFSLHGSDLLVQNTPSKKKKRKKNKEAASSTPINNPAVKSANAADGCFATPKSKAKNKKQKSKSLTDKLIPSVDVYDSDSNQSIADLTKNKNPYIVTDKSLPCVDVYESDSNQSEIVKEINTDRAKTTHVFEAYSSDSSVSSDKPQETQKSTNKFNTQHDKSMETVDLTDNDKFTNIDNTGIRENIVMANVTGFTEPKDHGDENRFSSSKRDISKYVSSKVPAILNEDLDFDNLKGKNKICKRRPYSLTTLHVEMDKFYNESWGGEDFNHREIQKHMSRDKSLWVIDPKDRMPSLTPRKIKCNYCNRFGHRDDICRQKPPVCYMCGNTGHYEPRCPSKICVNCGAPNFMYSTMCRNCSTWPNMTCAECGQVGHPASHCPDVWRRYHNTINPDGALEASPESKIKGLLFCSGCSKRGHLVHSCRTTLPFSGLPINSPFVRSYRPIYAPTQHNQNKQYMLQRSKSFPQETIAASASVQRPDRNKRLSKSPTVHEIHANKKRNTSVEETELNNTKSPTVTQKNPPAKEIPENAPKNKNKGKSLDASASVAMTEKAPDFISIKSSNHDNKGHVIQDNEVSDTSEVVTSARVYVPIDFINKLKTKDGKDWLKGMMEKLNVVVENAGVPTYLSIKGKFADQEAFQSEMRAWTQSNINKAKNLSSNLSNLPKNRFNLLQQLTSSLDLLKDNLGDPKALYKELTYSQNKHEKLLKQKVISPFALSMSRKHINNTLKKLNIILIGQAGLADGMHHVKELLSLKQHLTNSHLNIIPKNLREEIEEHYHIIFSPIARDDYSELMHKYYLPNSKAEFLKKKKKQNFFQQSPKPQEVEDNSIPCQQKNEQISNVINNNANHIVGCNNSEKDTHLKQLMFYHERLQSRRPKGEGSAAAKQELAQLMRRVHACIGILYRKDKLASKMSKKMRRVQEHAQKFLDNLAL